MSSAGINFSGLASGIDTRAVIEALLAVERRPITALQTKKQSYEKQKSLFGDLETKLTALRNKAKAVKTAGTFLEFKATPENETNFTASASNGATVGSWNIEVVDLARAKVATSLGRADKSTTTYGTGDIRIDVGSTTALIPINGETLEGIAAKINSDPIAKDLVQASVLDTGAPTNRYQLVVTSKTSGAAGSFSITSEAADPALATLIAEVAAGTTATAADAQIKINGILVTRSTNSITDAIPGVTISLKAKHATPGSTTKLTVTTDATAVAKKVKELTDAYNDIVDFVKAQNEQDGKGKAKNPLFGDSTLSTIRSSLRGIAGATFDTGSASYSMLAQVGVTSDRDGKLSFDEGKFTTAVTTDENAVKSLFADATNGIALRLHDRADAYLSTVDGLITTRKQGFDRLIKSVDDQVVQGEKRLERYELQLKNKFAAMESLLSRLQGQGSALSAINNSNR